MGIEIGSAVEVLPEYDRARKESCICGDPSCPTNIVVAGQTGVVLDIHPAEDGFDTTYLVEMDDPVLVGMIDPLSSLLGDNALVFYDEELAASE